MVRYAAPVSAPFGVARDQALSTVMSPALNSCASAGAAAVASASARARTVLRVIVLSFLGRRLLTVEVRSGPPLAMAARSGGHFTVNSNVPWVWCVSTETACHLTV